MRVLVTGGCGFIGWHMVERLLVRGDEVTIIDDLSGVGAHTRASGRTLDDRRIQVPPLHNYKLPRSLYGSYAFHEPDVVFHFAAVSRTVPAMYDPYRCFESNVNGALSVLEMARQSKRNGKTIRVVLSSSNVVYAADTPYKASKLMMEEAAKAYHETYGLSVICLRYSNVYGPGIAKGDPACLAAMRDSYTDKGYIEITGDGKQTRDFTHVRDIVRGNELAAESEYCGVVDLCTGVNHSMNNAGYYLLLRNPNVMPGAYEKYVRRVGDRQGDIKHIVQDPKPAEKILGWRAEVGFEEGVKDVWTY